MYVHRCACCVRTTFVYTIVKQTKIKSNTANRNYIMRLGIGQTVAHVIYPFQIEGVKMLHFLFDFSSLYSTHTLQPQFAAYAYGIDAITVFMAILLHINFIKRIAIKKR